MIKSFVLIICIAASSNEDAIFSKIIGYNTQEECVVAGEKAVTNISPSFKGARFICRPFSNEDYAYKPWPDNNKECYDKAHN